MVLSIIYSKGDVQLLQHDNRGSSEKLPQYFQTELSYSLLG